MLSSDQRGSPFVRRFDGDNNSVATVDIGAAERQGAPTAALASIAGRVVDTNGRGLGRATVRLFDGVGKPRVVLTSPFGYFAFEGLQSGQAYVLQTTRRPYRFDPLVVSLVSNVTDVALVASLDE